MLVHNVVTSDRSTYYTRQVILGTCAIVCVSDKVVVTTTKLLAHPQLFENKGQNKTAVRDPLHQPTSNQAPPIQRHIANSKYDDDDEDNPISVPDVALAACLHHVSYIGASHNTMQEQMRRCGGIDHTGKLADKMMIS